MASVVKRGHELRRAVRQRRRTRWLGVVGSSVTVAAMAALVGRTPDALFSAALCASVIALLTNVVTFIPAMELRALRSDVTRPPLTRVQARRWAFGGLMVGTLAVAAALIFGALADAWLTAVAIAAPFALMSAVWAFFMVRAGQRERLER